MLGEAAVVDGAPGAGVVGVSDGAAAGRVAVFRGEGATVGDAGGDPQAVAACSVTSSPIVRMIPFLISSPGGY